MSILDETVYGERVGDLLPALEALYEGARWDKAGTCRISAALEPDQVQPIWRAIMRSEAELLLEDADALRLDWDREDRTGPQRAVDALVRLVRAVSALLPPTDTSQRRRPAPFLLPPPFLCTRDQ